MHDRSSGTIGAVQRRTRRESPAGRGTADGRRNHGRGPSQSRSRRLNRRNRAPNYGGPPGYGRDGPCSVSRPACRKICATFQTRSASFHRSASPPLLRPDSRETKTFNNRTARDRRRCRLGSVRDGGGGGLDRWDRVDATGAGRRHPAHWLWTVCGQSEWCSVDDRNGLVIAKSICDRLAMGNSPTVAARQVLRMLVSRIRGSAGVLVLSPDGRFAIRHITLYMAAGWWNGIGQPTVRGQFP